MRPRTPEYMRRISTQIWFPISVHSIVCVYGLLAFLFLKVLIQAHASFCLWAACTIEHLGALFLFWLNGPCVRVTVAINNEFFSSL